MNNKKCSSDACNVTKDHIKGIKCDVKSCVYHDSDTHCTAGQIAVGNSLAMNAACDTFKERK
jgi:hypothetical protein